MNLPGRSFTVATLSVELDNLRNNICPACKRKLASGNVLVPETAISVDQGSTGTVTSVSAPLWRRLFRGRQLRPPSKGPSHSLAEPQSTNTTSLHVPSEPGVSGILGFSQTTPVPIHPGGSRDIISSEEKPKPPEWSVLYNSEVKRALNIHLAHAFTFDSPVYCVKMAPDGQRIAVGVEYEGKTFINELRTGTNVWLVSERLVYDLS